MRIFFRVFPKKKIPVLFWYLSVSTPVAYRCPIYDVIWDNVSAIISFYVYCCRRLYFIIAHVGVCGWTF